MKNTLKLLGLSVAAITFLSISGGRADVRIHGQNFPDGCREITRTINGTQMWGVDCPIRDIDPRIERGKRVDPPSFGGFPSNNSVKRQPEFQRNVRCKASIHTFMNHLGSTVNRLTYDLNGPPRVRRFTSEAARGTRNRLRSWGMGIMDRGNSIYRNRRAGEDGDGLCAIYMGKAQQELTRVINLLKTEAAKGNRDLTGTGLNSFPSVYNK